MIFHGYDYAMDKFAHPGYPGIGAGSNPLYSSFNAGGKDGSFLFQTVNKNCLNIITPAARTGIPTTNGNQLGWYFPCNVFSQYGDSPVNKTGYAAGQLCHTQDSARTLFNQAATQQVIGMQLQGPVYYSWDQIQNTSRNLGVYKQNVLDFSLFNWLDSSQVTYPSLFNTLALGNNSEFRGSDITAQVVRNGQRDVAECMADIITVGFVDSETIGCIASDVVLYVSLVFIIGVVALKFGMAVLFTCVGMLCSALTHTAGSSRGDWARSRTRRPSSDESARERSRTGPTTSTALRQHAIGRTSGRRCCQPSRGSRPPATESARTTSSITAVATRRPSTATSASRSVPA